MLSPLDLARLHDALALAEAAVGVTEPNPRVGCVIAAADGRLVGQGATQQAGGPHAEVMALRQAAAAGAELRGATVWVTLEPCAHHGRTPPCCDALAAAGVARVVAALQDPFPAVAGQGFARLRAAGIRVDLPDPAVPAEAALAAAAHELNIGFFSRVQRGRPWVRLKLAASLDGRTALPDGRSQWITGAAARADGHAWRRRAGAVLTGIGTVLADDPRLDVRLVPSPGQPTRVVLDSRLALPPAARIVAPPGALQLFTVADGGMADPARAQRRAALEAAGATVLALPSQGGRVALPAALAALAARGVNELHVECGATLAGALLDGGHVDELLLYLAPRLLGEGRGLAVLPGAAPDLLAAPDWRFHETVAVGEDLRLRLRRRG